MISRDNLILTTSPPSESLKNPYGTASLRHRQRLLYGRERRNNTGKERDYVSTAEYHERGKSPTVTDLHKDALMYMNDTNLYGGARWND